MGMTIREAVELHLDDKVRLGRITPRTLAVQRRMFDVLLQHFDGERDVAEVTRGEARAFLAAFSEGRRPTYVNTVLSAASALFGWAEREAEARAGNPFARLRMVDRERPSERRHPFTDDDLRAIWPTVREQRDAGRRWVPELMLRLGMRPEEAAQLHTRDLGEERGLPYLHVRAGEGQRLKNSASERKLPLLDGLQPFLSWAMKQPDGFLFGAAPGCLDRGRCTRISNWYTETMRRHGIEDPKKVLYSLRHTVATRLALAEVPHERIGDLLGHERKTTAGRVYVSVCPAWQHVETLRKLRLPEELAC